MKNKINYLPSPRKPKTLDDILNNIDADAIKASDLKHLVVQFINDTPDDPSDVRGHRARLRLEGLRLLTDILKLESKESSLDSSVLQLIKDNTSGNIDMPLDETE